MDKTANVNVIFYRLSQGEEITTEEQQAAILHLHRMITLRHAVVRPREGNPFMPASLRDGRVVDVFTDGRVQVYDIGFRPAYWLLLPAVDTPGDTVRLTRAE